MNNKKFQLESDLNNETFKLKINSTGSINAEEDVMTLNCSTNTNRVITFDNTTGFFINGPSTGTSATLFKIFTNPDMNVNGGSPGFEIQQGTGGNGGAWQLGNNGDVLFGAYGANTQLLKFYTTGANISFWGTQLGQSNQFASIGSTMSDFLSNDTRVKRLKLRPNTHTTTIQENGSIAGDITLTLPSTSGTLATTNDVLGSVFNISGTTMIADPRADDSDVCSQFTISSGPGSNGDCLLLIQADTDDGDETANPKIQLRQDGGSTNAFIELQNNDLLIGGTQSAADTILYTNGGTLGISNDSGSSKNIATFSSALANLQSTATKVVKLQTNTIEGTNESSNKITSNTSYGWDFEAGTPNRTIAIKNGSSYYPFIGSLSSSVPYLIHINSVSGDAYQIQNSNNTQAGLTHSYGDATIEVAKTKTDQINGKTGGNADIKLTIETTDGFVFDTSQQITGKTIAYKRGTATYFPTFGTESDSIPYRIDINGVSGYSYKLNNTNNTGSGLVHQFTGTVRADYHSGLTYPNNQLQSTSIGWDLFAVEPRYALKIDNNTDYYPLIGTPNATTLFQIYINTINDTAYEIINTNNTQDGIRHELKGNCVEMSSGHAAFKHSGDYTYLYSPEGTNGAATFGGSYISYHNNGSAIYSNLPGGGTSSGDYYSWATNNTQKARIGMDGEAYITGSWNGSWSGSDRRLKENIVPIENAVDTLMKINVYQFDKYDIDNYDTIHHEGEEKDTLKPFKERLSKNTKFVYGFIAQELCEDTPEIGKMCVNTNDWGEEEPAYIYNDRPILACAIKTIQEQQTEINTLKSIINKLISAPSFKAFKESIA